LPHTLACRAHPSGEEIIINTKSPEEAEADFFAGELLVPLELLKAESNKQIPHLSKVFAVSEQVVSIAVSRHMNALFK
jgi:Zn-dependent peptidase ImmA (M78 family)